MVVFVFRFIFFFREGERCKTSFATEKIEESELQTAIKVKFKKNINLFSQLFD